MKRKLSNILVTGGCGFIGSNFIRYLFNQSDFAGRIINLDVLTYAGNALSLADIADTYERRYLFVRGDICDKALVEGIFKKYDIDTVVHFAAESHVDRSIAGPDAFVRTNVTGTFTLLEASRQFWHDDYEGRLFHHISTDEVYGSLGASGFFTELTPYDPRSPYSASKACSDHFATAYYHTYGLPVTLSNCSNNYGPYQFPEKLMPLMILNMLEGKMLPVYGDGRNIRDWLYVEDHCSAVWKILKEGRAGEKYNIGGENEWENIKLLKKLIEIVAEKTGKSAEAISETISYVKDRPGHDRRYAIDCGKIKAELGWRQGVTFTEGLRRTVDWYLANRAWVDGIRSRELC
jgi:dTDP-glucose 4,6-dehydratase